jgi:hypothetical protein
MRLVAFMIAALTLSGTASQAGGPQSTPYTSVTIVALNAWVGRAVFHLSCAPPGGDLPDPAQACSALDQKPELVTDPQPFVCRGGPTSHWAVRISGQLNGEAIRVSLYTCWTSQMPTIAEFGLTLDVLRKHLVQRRHKRVPAGTTRRFASGVLRATDLVICDIRGYPLKVGVPVEAGGQASVSYGGTYPVVVLTVAHNRTGSVTAICHRGKR